MQKPEIIFIEVRDNTSKLNKICATVQHHFTCKERILIAVPSPEAAQYIDQLLWRLPEESFLPHVVAQKPCKDMIVITTAAVNINGAHILFNLRSEPMILASGYDKIYELLDYTHAEKENLSRQRLAIYQAQGFLTIRTADAGI